MVSYVPTSYYRFARVGSDGRGAGAMRGGWTITIRDPDKGFPEGLCRIDRREEDLNPRAPQARRTAHGSRGLLFLFIILPRTRTHAHTRSPHPPSPRPTE